MWGILPLRLPVLRNPSELYDWGMHMDCRFCKAEIPDGSVFCNFCGRRQQPATKKHGRRTRGNGMGTVEKTKTGYKAILTVGWREVEIDTPEGKKKKMLPVRRTKSGFATKREALQYIPQLSGRRTDRKPSTIEDLYQSWSTSAMLNLSKSQQTSMRIAHNRLKDIWYIPIAELRINDLQAAVDEQTETYYPARDMRVLLSHLYKRAMAQQEVSVNLSEFIVLPPLDEKEQVPFNEAEIKALWAAYTGGDTFVGYLLLMIYSGMMPGELFRARKDMIDWEQNLIVGAGLKTKKRKSTPIVLGDAVLVILRDLCTYSKSDKILCMNKWRFYDEYYLALERCGCRPLKPYSCRHTTATALALDGSVPSVIQEIMRHTKFATTQRYIHVNTTPMVEAINKISAQNVCQEDATGKTSGTL